MFKNLPLYFFLLITFFSNAQSNPQPLANGLSVQRIMTVQNGSIRLTKDPVSGHLLYAKTNGEIYMVIQPSAGAAYDSLIYTSADHGVQYVQGMRVHDSLLFVSGNNNSNSPLTTGIISKGKANASGGRTWSLIMETEPYQTADYFDHLFSGLCISPAGDSLFICSGARGDHGEVETRYGLYPGLRNTPLTTNIYQLPVNRTDTIILLNDQQWLDTSGFIYCRGIRNTFDMSFDGNGQLFGVENSGDRDHNEEMNWLIKGVHYGFPWKMGDTYNPQQYSWFDPSTDLLINHFCRSWRIGAWSNDPQFPSPPAVTFKEPIQNFGPDCDKFRDSITGGVLDASDLGISLGTFTAHRSPLGLVFDVNNILDNNFRGDGYMLSWTQGLDSSGATTVPDTAVGPFVDPSQDLVQLHLTFVPAINNYTLNATTIVKDFIHPVDAVMDSNFIYVLENGYAGNSGLYKISFPVYHLCTPTVSVEYPDPCQLLTPPQLIIQSNGIDTMSIIVKDHLGNLIDSIPQLVNADTVFNVLPDTIGYTIFSENTSGCRDTILVTVNFPTIFGIDSMTMESCSACNDGVIYFHLRGMGPFLYTVNPPLGTISGDSLYGLPGGNYSICVTDAMGCMRCDSVHLMTVGINGFDKNDIRIYPNPAGEYFYVEIKNNKTAEPLITDLTGRSINLKYNVVESGEKKLIRYDTSELTEGIYFINVNNRVVQRLVICR